MGTKSEIVYGEEKKYFVLGRLEQPQERTKKLLYRQDKPNEPTEEATLFSFAFFESPFTSVSTVSWGHPSQVSLTMLMPNLALVEMKLTTVKLFFEAEYRISDDLSVIFPSSTPSTPGVYLGYSLG
jgi:hypothetical protein